MITVLVQFDLAEPIDLPDASRLFAGTAEKYRAVPGLVRKYYIRAEDGRRAGGVYLWENRAAAEDFYNGEWRAMVTERYGGPPTLVYFDSPVIVDNLAGTISRD